MVFGSGTVAQLRAEAERLGVRRVLVLSTPGRSEAQARDVAALLGDLAVGIHAGAVMHTPVEATETAVGDPLHGFLLDAQGDDRPANKRKEGK